MAEEKDKTPDGAAAAPDQSQRVQKQLVRIGRMFNDYRDDKLMRELCRLAVKVAQERLIGG